jgi:hypothetical protein
VYSTPKNSGVPALSTESTVEPACTAPEESTSAGLAEPTFHVLEPVDAKTLKPSKLLIWAKALDTVNIGIITKINLNVFFIFFTQKLNINKRFRGSHSLSTLIIHTQHDKVDFCTFTNTKNRMGAVKEAFCCSKTTL